MFAEKNITSVSFKDEPCEVIFLSGNQCFVSPLSDLSIIYICSPKNHIRGSQINLSGNRDGSFISLYKAIADKLELTEEQRLEKKVYWVREL